MKKLLVLSSLAATIICCNTPQPATTTNTGDTMSTSTNQNRGTTGTTGTTTDTTTRRDSTRQR